MHTDFFYLLFLFSVWWEVICCNAWSGRFERAISSRCAGPFLCGGARLFLFLYQHQPLKLKDSAAAEAKWDFAPLCFLFLVFLNLLLAAFLTLVLPAPFCLTLTLSQVCSPGNAQIKSKEGQAKTHRCHLMKEKMMKNKNKLREKVWSELHILLLIARHERNSFQQVFAASKPCLKGEQWCQLLL